MTLQVDQESTGPAFSNLPCETAVKPRTQPLRLAFRLFMLCQAPARLAASVAGGLGALRLLEDLQEFGHGLVNIYRAYLVISE